MQNNFNGTNKQPIYQNGQLNSNQNRKLTPNKVNIGLKANSSLGQHPNAMRPGDMGRNFDNIKKNGKNNSRSNTIEQQFDKDSKKSVKRKERASSTIEHADNDPNMALMANGQSQVQVSQTGSLLIGPGGRPKTSQGKNGPVPQTNDHTNTNTNSRMSHYSANAQNQGIKQMNVSHGGSNYGLPKAAQNVQLRQNVQLKQGGIGMPAHQRSTST